MDKQTIENYFMGDYQPFYRRYLEDQQRGSGNEVKAICPFHLDTDPSLSINRETGQHYCFGCKASGDIFTFYAKMNGLTLPGDFPKVLAGIARDFGISGSSRKNVEQAKKQTVIKRYDYHDEGGSLVYQIERRGPIKDFRARRPDGNGEWIYNIRGIRLRPYHLLEVLKADEVLIVEGEKDADTLAKLGFTATTNPFGAGKWPDHFGPYFAGKHVVLIPDNDDHGRTHMHKVAANLKGHAASIKWLDLPGLPDKGDVSDWLEKSHDR